MTRKRKYDLDEAITLIWENISQSDFVEWGLSEGMTSSYARILFKRLKRNFKDIKTVYI